MKTNSDSFNTKANKASWQPSIAIKKILRDNTTLNPVLRNLLRICCKFIKPLQKITSVYRIYGTVPLSIGDVHFKILSKSDDHIANEIFYNRGYELGEFRLIRELTKRSNYFIDVGANTGLFSIYAAVANKKLQVVSFEPHPRNFDRLRHNISINSLTNVQAFSIALGSRNTELEFAVPYDLSISTTASLNTVYSKNFHEINSRQIVVEQQKGDDALAGFPITPLDVLKIDVEYYELEVLKGAASILQNKRPLIIIEILQYDQLIAQYPDMQGKIDENHALEIFDFLTRLTYHCYAIAENGLNYVAAIKGQQNRNFLFTPFKLSQSNCTFEDFEKFCPEGWRTIHSIPIQ